MRCIELTHGQVAIVDDEDFDELAQYRWYYLRKPKGGYAARMPPRGDGKRRTILMHREILGLPPGKVPEVDHRNTNKLDNRRQNLRIATRQQNMWNRPALKSSKTGVKGVSLNMERSQYIAQISQDGKPKFLGYFDTIDEAKAAYNAAATKIQGEFARLN